MFQKVLIVGLLIITGLTGFGQNVLSAGFVPAHSGNFNNVSTDFQPEVKMSLGSSFTTFSPEYTAFYTWIMPEISWQVNKKLTLSGGIGYSNLFTSNTSGNNNLETTPQQYGSFFVKGNYQINEKISISALAYKTFNLVPQTIGEKVNPRAFDLKNSGALIQVDYKVSDHFRINAAFSIQKQNLYNPYLYQQQGFGRPFSPSTYSRFFTGF